MRLKLFRKLYPGDTYTTEIFGETVSVVALKKGFAVQGDVPFAGKYIKDSILHLFDDVYVQG